MPESEWEGVKVSLAGPLFGLLAAIPFFILFLVLGGKVWLLGAVVIAAINLINLAPAPPLDGSRALGPVLARIHPMVEKGAMIAMGALVVLACAGVTMAALIPLTDGTVTGALTIAGNYLGFGR